MVRRSLVRLDEAREEYGGLLKQWPGPLLQAARVGLVADLGWHVPHGGAWSVSPAPGRGEVEGWVVLQRERSASYPAVRGFNPERFLATHVGRVAMGLGTRAARLDRLGRGGPSSGWTTHLWGGLRGWGNCPAMLPQGAPSRPQDVGLYRAVVHAVGHARPGIGLPSPGR
jgi:hypothetical protein